MKKKQLYDYKYFKPSEFQQIAWNLRQNGNADWQDGMDNDLSVYLVNKLKNCQIIHVSDEIVAYYNYLMKTEKWYESKKFLTNEKSLDFLCYLKESILRSLGYFNFNTTDRIPIKHKFDLMIADGLEDTEPMQEASIMLIENIRGERMMKILERHLPGLNYAIKDYATEVLNELKAENK